MRKNNGAALITALLVIAIVAAIATTLMSQLQIDIQRSELNFNADRAYLQAQGVRDWAIVKYQAIYTATKNKLARPKWPIVMNRQKLAGGYVSGYLENAADRFNINDLTDTAYQPILARLIQQVQPQTSYQQAMSLAKNVTNWLIPSVPNATADSQYLRLKPPYRVAHRLMVSASELRLVSGFSANLYQRLTPYIIALPKTATSIDVNAAPKLLLIAGGVSISGAAAVVNYLKQNPGFNSMEAFQKISQFKYSKSKDSKQVFNVNSDFYYARANIVLGKVYFVAFYLLQYNTEQRSLQVIRYSQGTL